MKLSSPAFKEGGMIPARYTCDGENVSPPLAIAEVPEEARSLVLVMDDPDIPEEVKRTRGIEVFDHWVVYDLTADTRELPEGAIAGLAGQNGAGKAGYIGPCPPPEYEPKTHRYHFALYALSGAPAFEASPTKAELLAAIRPMTIAEARLTGRYARA